MGSDAYDRPLVESLLPTIFDREYAWGIVNEKQSDPDMPRTPTPKNQTHTLWAHLADIRIAWQRTPLSREEKQAIVLVGGMGMTFPQAGHFLHISKQAVQHRYERAVGKLTANLNGKSYAESLDELLAAA